MWQFIRRAYERWEGSEFTHAFGWILISIFTVQMVTKILMRIDRIIH